jgi:predicted porin
MRILRIVPAAVALACAAGPVHGQTANLTLYGRLNLDVEAVRGDDNGWRTRVSSNSSRFGLRGSESLGGGHEAFFQIESSVNGDAGGGSIAGRDSFVGLRGAWGSLRLGNIKTPYDLVNNVFGNVPTFSSSILDTESVWGNGSSLASGGIPYRAANSVRYDLPGIRLQGLNAGLHYATGETGNDAATWAVGGTWNDGPWYAGAVYQFNHRMRDTATVTGLEDQAYSLALAYKFGIVRLAGVWEQLKYDTATGSLKRDFWGVSATFDVGPGQVYAYYGNGSDGKGGAATGERVGGLAKGPDTGVDHYEISYTHPLSKRTSWYAGYVKIDNDANASYTFATNALAINPGGKPEGFILGLSHNF